MGISKQGEDFKMEKEMVLIEWIDSKGMTNWEDIDGLEPMPPCVCYTVGFLLDDNKDYKTVVLTLSKEQILGRLTIPSCCITSIRKLRYAKRK